MDKKTMTPRFAIKKIIFLIGLMLVASTAISQENIQKLFMGIELNNVLCGYSEILLKKTSEEKNSYLQIDQKTYVTFKALGKDITQKQIFTYKINPETGNFIYHDSYTEQGEQKISAAMEVDGDTITVSSSLDEESQKVFLPDDVLLPNIVFYPHLRRDFGVNKLASKTYNMFDVKSGKVRKIQYTNTRREQVRLNNKEYTAVIVRESDPEIGLETKYWIDIESGLRLKMESQNNIRMFLADMSVVNKVKTGSWDDIFFIKTNEEIKDIRRISSIKVKAVLEAIPAASTVDLNVTGQTFNGNIETNTLSGIFEVSHLRYSGENALRFGSNNTFNKDVSRFLKAEEMIESDHPELISLALKIVKGSSDFWEATCRLSAWVANNIDGSIYGGSAYATFKRGNAACGSQSMLLAALCRAAGIPARVVWGCLYTPEYGGSFGHHGWNEVYMGGAGWIPIDVTIHETNYVDSGHIRLGILKTKLTVINFKEMTILDYGIVSKTM